MYNFVVITVHADGLAPLGARTSADTLMIPFGSHIYIYIYISDVLNTAGYIWDP